MLIAWFRTLITLSALYSVPITASSLLIPKTFRLRVWFVFVKRGFGEGFGKPKVFELVQNAGTS